MLQAGVTRGMKLTAISDPIRRDEVWELQVGGNSDVHTAAGCHVHVAACEALLSSGAWRVRGGNLAMS